MPEWLASRIAAAVLAVGSATLAAGPIAGAVGHGGAIARPHRRSFRRRCHPPPPSGADITHRHAVDAGGPHTTTAEADPPNPAPRSTTRWRRATRSGRSPSASTTTAANGGPSPRPTSDRPWTTAPGSWIPASSARVGAHLPCRPDGRAGTPATAPTTTAPTAPRRPLRRQRRRHGNIGAGRPSAAGAPRLRPAVGEAAARPGRRGRRASGSERRRRPKPAGSARADAATRTSGLRRGCRAGSRNGPPGPPGPPPGVARLGSEGEATWACPSPPPGPRPTWCRSRTRRCWPGWRRPTVIWQAR